MNKERIEELQNEFCFSIGFKNGEKGIIPHTSTQKLKNNKLLEEIKEGKWDIIAWIEERDERWKQEKIEREKKEKEDDIAKIEELKKSGNLIYYFCQTWGDYKNETSIGTGFHDFKFAKTKNIKEEYCENYIFFNSATEKYILKNVWPKEINFIRDYYIGIEDHYFEISENEYNRLLALDTEKEKEIQKAKDEKRMAEKKAKEEELENMKKKAKETDEVQWKSLGIIECQGGVEDCSFDSVSLAVYPDGTKKEVISHCY